MAEFEQGQIWSGKDGRGGRALRRIVAAGDHLVTYDAMHRGFWGGGPWKRAAVTPTRAFRAWVKKAEAYREEDAESLWLISPSHPSKAAADRATEGPTDANR
jgi:hypothetical protein